MIAPARLAAYEVLRAVKAGRRICRRRSRRRADDSPMSATARWRERLRPARLRWQGAFDVVIEAFAKRPIAKLDARSPRHPANDGVPAAAP